MNRVAIAAVSLSVVFLGAVGPVPSAGATDQITLNAVGTYEIKYKNNPAPSSAWVVSPCEDDAPKCIKVEEFGLADTARKSPSWSSRAHWVVGSWIMDAVDGKRSCEDGSRYGVAYNYSWDAAKNSGWRSYNEPGICDGKKAGGVSVAFNLLRVGPPSAEG